jgi:hypothetical protein
MRGQPPGVLEPRPKPRNNGSAFAQPQGMITGASPACKPGKPSKPSTCDSATQTTDPMSWLESDWRPSLSAYE